MTALTIGKNAQAVLEIAQWIRNGKAPVAELQNKLATMAGYAANVRAKLIFRSRGGLVATGGTSAIPDSLATRRRWRFPWHSSPYVSFIYARFEIAPQNNGTATDPYCTLTVRNPARQLIGTATMHGGSSGGSYADVPVNMTGGTAHLVDGTGAFVFLDPDTDYTGLFTDVGFARLQSASVWEVALQPKIENGYASNMHGSLSPIYSSDRDDIAAMARLLHKRSGTPIFHWCSDIDSVAPSQSGSANTAQAAQTLAPITVSSTGTTLGSGVVDATLGAITVSSTGTTASFDAHPALTTASLPGQFHVEASANSAQTNGAVYVAWYGPLVSFTTINLDGWSETGWTVGGSGGAPAEFEGPTMPNYYNILTRTSVSSGTTYPTWSITRDPSFTGWVYYISTVFAYATPPTVPHTDQATGGGGTLSSALT